MNIANKVVNRDGHDALARSESSELLRCVLSKERSSHTHNGHRRNLSNGAPDLFEDYCYLGETKTSAAVGFGHADSDDAEVGEFTPKHEIDTTGIFDLLEMLHRATVGKDPIGKSTKLFLI
ncbi:unannotated protein [freshwater metagenome]|uniref:Unannotated protein n=1 Tax=freshwater metagenome TaxID=449393 RepID=A0A6J7P0E6_9ZZZZ